jgi:hypothetical protein
LKPPPQAALIGQSIVNDPVLSPSRLGSSRYRAAQFEMRQIAKRIRKFLTPDMARYAAAGGDENQFA